jgi:hypothetical protein
MLSIFFKIISFGDFNNNAKTPKPLGYCLIFLTELFLGFVVFRGNRIITPTSPWMAGKDTLYG